MSVPWERKNIAERLKLPFQTPFGVMVFAEDFILAAQKIDEEKIAYDRERYAETGEVVKRLRLSVLLNLIFEGKSKKAIAEQFGITPESINNNIERIRRQAEWSVGIGVSPLISHMKRASVHVLKQVDDSIRKQINNTNRY
jgi:hypothetical protein